MITLLCVIFLIVAVNACMTAMLFKRHADMLTRERWETAAELTQDVEEDKAAAAERRERESSAMFDEGIENIMAYSVKGKTE